MKYAMRADEQEAWAVNIGCINPDDEEAMNAAKTLLKHAQEHFAGYYGVFSDMPRGVFMVFATFETAIEGQAAIKAAGVATYGLPVQVFMPIGGHKRR